MGSTTTLDKHPNMTLKEVDNLKANTAHLSGGAGPTWLPLATVRFHTHGHPYIPLKELHPPEHVQGEQQPTLGKNPQQTSEMAEQLALNRRNLGGV